MNSLSETEVSDTDVTPRIKAFIERDASANTQKDGSVWSVDSAVWYVEAGLNLGLATAWVDCSEQTLDSLEFTLQKNSDGITRSNTFSVFEFLRDEIGTRLVPNENHLILADVAAYDSGTTLTFKVIVLLGSGYHKTNQLITSYGPSEFIYYGFGQFANNNCGCNGNQSSTTCADIRIAQRVNAALPGIQYPCYYTNLESRGVSWMQNASNLTWNLDHTNFPSGVPSTPYKTYFCNTGISCNNCFSPALMSFYTQGAWDVMNQLTPSGKVRISAVLDDHMTLCGENCSSYFHACLFSYGKLNCPRN